MHTGLFQVHSDGFISLQTTGSSPASKESDPVISVYLSDVDTSGIGQIYYGYNIMHYRTWTLKIKSSMCIINFTSRVSTLVEQLKMCNGTCCYCLFSGWRQTTHTFSRSLSCWFLSILQTHSLQGSWLLSRGVVLATIRMEPIRS